MFRRIAFVTTITLLASAPLHAGENSASVERLRKDLTYLASDECEGRGAQTQGLHKAADYIAAEFQRLGLKPGGTNGSYFQPYTMRSGRSKLSGTNSVTLKGPLGQEIELKLGEQFQVVGFAGSGVVSAPVVFAGYGLSTPKLNYDDYKDIDVKGKIVIVMRKTPMPGSTNAAFGGNDNPQIASLSNKVVTADQAKAAAILFVNDRDTVGGFLGDRLMPFEYTSEADSPAGIPSVHISRGVCDSLLQSGIGRELKDVEREIDRDLKPKTAALTGWTATVQVHIDRPSVQVKNVIGILPGSGPLAKEYVIVGAHYDHLGRGERGSLERDEKRRTLIHHGADDNGSGTVSVIELARRFMEKKYEGRTLVFMTFSGEEQGLLGSRHFCKSPTVSLEQTAAMVNLDMVGRVRPDKDSKKDRLEIGGIGTAKEFGPLVDELNKKYEFQLAKTASGFGPSDHTSFAEKKVPVFFFFTGLHNEYHKPADTVDTINFPGMEKVVDMCEDLIGKLTMMKDKPQYLQTSRGAMGGVRGDVPRLGFMPGNYDENENKGVLIGGVTKNGPGDKGGLKEGDFIVEIAGKPVKNMAAYMTIMSGQKKGELLELTVDRGGKRMKVTVKPE